MFSRSRRKDKGSKIKIWTKKMDGYYVNASDKKLTSDLKKAGFKINKK